MGAMFSKTSIAIDAADLANGDSIAAYLTDAAGALLTSTLIGAKQSLDALEAASHVDGTAYVAASDYLSSIGVVNNAGNWVPITLNAAGEIPVAATVNFAGDYAEDSAHVSGDTGIFTLLVRQDTLAASTSTDGDYGAFKSNNLGELYVFDTTTHTTLTAILADTATIDSQTLSIQNTLTALSKAEDSAHVSGDQGIMSLAVRNDATSALAGTTGDYAPVQVDALGRVKVLDRMDSTILQQTVTVANTATLLPATALANRHYVMVQNRSGANVWIGSATVTTTGATEGVRLANNDAIGFDLGPNVGLYAIVASGTRDVQVLELA